jgi:hypothetical protein
MTLSLPTAVEWIRFDDPSGGWLQLDTEEQWQPQLRIGGQGDPGVVDLDAPARVESSRLVAIDLVLSDSAADFAAEAAIRRVHDFLAPRRHFGVEAAVVLPGLPYNCVRLPRVRVLDFATSRFVTADGKSGLRVLEGEACEVAPGGWCRLTRVPR